MQNTKEQVLLAEGRFQVREMMKMREEWIDSWRGLLIMLVVLGHALGCVKTLAGTEMVGRWVGCLIDFIYFFHVAAFFSVSGYLWRPKKNIKFLGRLFRRLMVPFYIWSIFSVCLYYAASKIVHLPLASIDGGLDSWILTDLECICFGKGLSVNHPLWFLPCLFLVECVYYLVDLFFSSKRTQVFLMTALAILFVVLQECRFSSLPFSIQLLPSALIYFAFGRWFVSKRMPFDLNSTNRCILAVVALLMLISLRFVRLAWVPVPILRYFLYLLIVCAALELVSLLSRAISCKMLATLGTLTIGILAVHRFILTALQVAFSKFARIDFSGDFAALLVSFVITGVALVGSSVVTISLSRIIPEIFGVTRNRRKS